MSQVHIDEFLRGVASVARIPQKLRDALNFENQYDRYHKQVKYSQVPDEPLNFYADVLSVRLIARLEYSKHVNNGRVYTSCQYAFFKIKGTEEERTKVVVRFLAPNHAIVNDGETIDIPLGNGNPGDDMYDVGLLQQAISRALLEDVIANLEEWAFK